MAAKQQWDRAALRKTDKTLPSTVVVAEAFAAGAATASSSAKTTVAFHVDYEAWARGFPRGEERCEIAGIGPVPLSVIDTMVDDAALRLLVSTKNKLTWYSEDNGGRLPENIKRAIRSRDFDTCCQPGCQAVATDVDHIEARTAGGTNDPSNLQSLCESCHRAKTKRDVPWTLGKYFLAGPHPSEPLCDVPESELFPDSS